MHLHTEVKERAPVDDVSAHKAILECAVMWYANLIHGTALHVFWYSVLILV